MIYADNAAKTKLLPSAFEAMNVPEKYAKGTIRIFGGIIIQNLIQKI